MIVAALPAPVLTTFDDDANLFDALRAGAAGYLLKDVSSETLVSAIHCLDRSRDSNVLRRSRSG